MYRDKEFRVRPLSEVREDVRMAQDCYGPEVRRAFLCDGDAMVLPTGHLVSILEALRSAFPDLQRVGVYANARDLLKKSENELRELVQNRLSIFYLGLESGSDRILSEIDKGATATEMAEAVCKGMACGMKSSVIYLLGMGGRKLWHENALDSAQVVSAMNPNYLSALTLTVVHGTPLEREMAAGRFELPGPEEFARELQLFIQNTDLRATVFRSNHASNNVPLAGRLPKDLDRLVVELGEAMKHHRFKPEYLRGL
jgi:radical SAM superfamily enzyme YgiQ (UPF0313 family)